MKFRVLYSKCRHFRGVCAMKTCNIRTCTYMAHASPVALWEGSGLGKRRLGQRRVTGSMLHAWQLTYFSLPRQGHGSCHEPAHVMAAPLLAASFFLWANGPGRVRRSWEPGYPRSILCTAHYVKSTACAMHQDGAWIMVNAPKWCMHQHDARHGHAPQWCMP